MKYKFEKVKSEPLGFDSQILELHQSFVAVKPIKHESQAKSFGIESGIYFHCFVAILCCNS